MALFYVWADSLSLMLSYVIYMFVSICMFAGPRPREAYTTTGTLHQKNTAFAGK